MAGSPGRLAEGDGSRAASVRVAVWAGREDAALVAAVAAGRGVELVAICAAEPTHAAAIVAAFAGLGVDDPRGLGTAGADLMWLAADREFPADARRALTGLPVLCSTSPINSLADVSEWATHCALAPSCSGALAMVDPHLIEHFGPIASGVIHLAAPDAAGGLGVRLLDLASLASTCLGLPESVSAAHTGSAGRSASSSSLRGLVGTMAVQLRYAEGRSITALLESSNRWRRLVRLIGPSGELSLDGPTLTWRGPADEIVEQSSVTETGPADIHLGREAERAAARATARATARASRRGPSRATVAPSATESVAEAIAALIRTPHCRHALRLEAYAIAEAARLSRLTGQPESPANLLAALTSPLVSRSA